ncbi:hypothetical protein V8E36_009324 [Tilletia maclaganii]
MTGSGNPRQEAPSSTARTDALPTSRPGPPMLTPSELAERLRVGRAAGGVAGEDTTPRRTQMGILQRLGAGNDIRETGMRSGDANVATVASSTAGPSRLTTSKGAAGMVTNRRQEGKAEMYAALSRVPRAPTMRPPIGTRTRADRAGRSAVDDGHRVQRAQADVNDAGSASNAHERAPSGWTPLMPRAQRVLHQLRQQQQQFHNARDGTDSVPTRIHAPNPITSTASLGTKASTSATQPRRDELWLRIQEVIFWNVAAGPPRTCAMLAIGAIYSDDIDSANMVPAATASSAGTEPSSAAQMAKPMIHPRALVLISPVSEEGGPSAPAHSAAGNISRDRTAPPEVGSWVRLRSACVLPAIDPEHHGEFAAQASGGNDSLNKDGSRGVAVVAALLCLAVREDRT